jgi:hypothetical protein
MVVVGTCAKSNCRFRTIVFLVWVCEHPTHRWWLQQAVIMHRDGLSWGPWIAFPMKLSCQAAIMCLTSGMLYNMLLILAFRILSSFTHVMLMVRMCQMLRCRKTSSLLSRLCRSDHVSQPHSSRFIGIAQKSGYLL